jgi:hypothetical protein
LELLATLNNYFEVTEVAITANGEEVLRVITEAVLALSQIDVDGISEHAAVKTAAAALLDAKERLLQINDTCITDSKSAISLGVALYFGHNPLASITASPA